MAGLRYGLRKKGLLKKGGKRTQAMVRLRKTVNVNRALQPFAQRYITKLKYSDQIKVTGPTGAGFSAFRFNLNSIYDPNRTGIGHQPYGFDQLAALYNRYRVIKCNYVISGINTAADGDQYSIIAACPANEQVNLLGGMAELIENPRTKWITQAPSAPLRMLKGSVYLPSLVGRNKDQYMADDRYQALTNSDPNELAILNIFAGSIDGDVQTNTMTLTVTLTYVVEFFDVKNQVQS